jgi:hypothetical protein
MPLPLIAAVAAASGILGGLTKKKTRNQYASPELSNAYKDYINRLGGDQPVYDKALADYTKDNEARIADVAGVSAQNRDDINKFMSYLSATESDPYNIQKRVTEDRLGYLKDFAGDLGQYGRGQRDVALARLGYSGGRGGSFVDSDRQNTISSNLAPAFSSIISGATPSATAIHSGRLSNINQGVGLLGNRLDTAYEGQGMQLNPALALSGLRGTELGLYGQLGQNINANIKGVREDQNWAGAASGGLDKAIQTFTSLYGMGALSGAGKAATTPAASSALPATGNYGQLASMAYNQPIQQPPPYQGTFGYGQPAQVPYYGQFQYNPYANPYATPYGNSIVQPPNYNPIGAFGNYGGGVNYRGLMN